MMTTKLSSKGQIVLPKEIRDALGWREGTELAVEETTDGVRLRPVHAQDDVTLEELVGCVGYDGPPRTIEDMDRAILQAVRKPK